MMPPRVQIVAHLTLHLADFYHPDAGQNTRLCPTDWQPRVIWRRIPAGQAAELPFLVVPQGMRVPSCLVALLLAARGADPAPCCVDHVEGTPIPPCT